MAKEVAEFYAKVESLKQALEGYTGGTNEIKQLHDQALHSIDAHQIETLGQAVEAKTSDLNRLGQQIAASLKELSKEASLLETAKKISSSQLRIRNSLLNNQTTKFSAAVKAFQLLQSSSKQAYAEQLKRQYQILKPNATKKELDALVASDQPTVSLFSAATQQQAEATLSKLSDRHLVIQKLEKSIISLHQLFLDMQLLLEMQGKVLEKIEDSVSQADEYTDEIVGDMKQAVVYQKKAWKLRMYLYSTVGIVLLVLIVVALSYVKGLLC